MSPETLNRIRVPLAIGGITVERIEGVAGRYELRDLCSGINLIYGPNASGKSRTAAAFQALIWPDTAPQRAEMYGSLSTPEHEWLVTCDDRRASYQRNGVPTDPPNLTGIPSAQRDRYLLSLHDLLHADAGAFAQLIQRESAGGYDVAVARDAAGIGKTAPKPQPNRTKVGYLEALGHRKQLRQRDLELQVEEGRLSYLDGQLRAAIAAAQEEQRLSDARDFLAAKVQLREAEVRRATFLDPIGQMTGKEVDQVEHARKRLDELTERRRQAEAAQADARNSLESTGFASHIPTDEVLTALRKRHSRLVERASALRAEKQTIASLRAVSANARFRLGETIDDTQWSTLDQRGLHALAELQRELAHARNIADARQELQKWVGAVQPPADLDTLRRAIDVLSARLRIPDDGSGPNERIKLTLLLAAGLIVLEAIVLGLKVSPFLGALSILAFPVALVGLRAETRPLEIVARDKEREYMALGVEPVTQWDPTTMRTTLDRLHARLAQGEIEREKANRWADLESLRQEADENTRVLGQKVKKVVDELGVSIDADPESIRKIADALDKWRNSIDDLAKAEARAETMRDEITQTLADINVTLSAHGAGSATDEASTEAAIAALEQRITRAQRAQSAIAQQAHVIDTQLQPEIDNWQAESDRIYRALGLEPGDLLTLREWCNRVPGCVEAQQILEQASTLVTAARRRLDSAPELATLSRDEIELRLAHAAQSAGRRDNLHAEISQINAEIDVAKRSSNLEEAIAAEGKAFDAFRDARDHDYAQVAGWQLASFIQKQTRDVNRPPVFRNARDLFATFTAGAFQLEIEEGNLPSLRATETATGKGRSLDELSSGTRVQLLMAVRLAFIETMEHGPQLPLVLDEVLGNTDDVRASAIIDATIEVCRRGRQVIYFTAQQDEIEKWRSRVSASNDPVPFAEFDLAEIRSIAGAARRPSMSWGTSVFARAAVPDGADYQSVRRIFHVPPIDPWAEQLDAVDLWYLIPDVAALSRLRGYGITNWGAFKVMRQLGIGSLIPSFESVSQRADLRVRALEAAIEKWRIGRTAPLTRQDLESSGAISPTFIHSVVDLADRCKWDGASLLDSLRRKEISGFRQKSIEDLEDYFRTSGFLTEAEPMPMQMVRAAAFAAVADNIREGELQSHEIDTLLVSIGDNWQEELSEVA